MSQLDRLVWIDCEMTGLDPEIDELVEIAVIVTDFDLIPVDDGLDLVICPSDGALAQMNDFVRTMHTDSGLLEALPGGDSLETATRTVLDYVKRHVPEPRRVPLAGNTIGTDRAFLARYMPDLDAHLHYRSVDVSTVKELAKRWFPRAYIRAPEKRGGHRALHDIQESILELRYYREAVFVPIPGPTSEELQAVTDRLTPGF